MAHESRHAVTPLVIVLLVMALALALGAAEARASDGGMAGMPGMTDQEMQNMTTAPTPAAGAASGSSMSGSSSTQAGALAPAMDARMDMGGGSINWFVIGGFVVLIGGSTLGAVATKRHLASRMAAGELAGAGALDV
jgi:hypothetical protein